MWSSTDAAQDAKSARGCGHRVVSVRNSDALLQHLRRRVFMGATSVVQAETRWHQSVESDGRCAGRKVSKRMRPQGRLSARQRRSAAALAAPSLHECHKCGAGADEGASECAVRRTLRRTQSQHEDAATGLSECGTATLCCSTCGAESSRVSQVWCRRRRGGIRVWSPTDAAQDATSARGCGHRVV